MLNSLAPSVRTNTVSECRVFIGFNNGRKFTVLNANNHRLFIHFQILTSLSLIPSILFTNPYGKQTRINISLKPFLRLNSPEGIGRPTSEVKWKTSLATEVLQSSATNGCSSSEMSLIRMYSVISKFEDPLNASMQPNRANLCLAKGQFPLKLTNKSDPRTSRM